ncbi:MAG: DUF4199 family protein [Gemmatimonadota bacterium]
MTFAAAFVPGTVFGAALVGYGVFFRRAGIGFQHPAALVFYGLAALSGGLPAWLAAGSGSVGFLRALLPGVLSSALAALVYALFVYVYNAHIDDGLLHEVRAHGLEKRRSQGSLDANAEARLTRLTQPAPFAASVFVSLTAAGALASLLSALLLRWTA